MRERKELIDHIPEALVDSPSSKKDFKKWILGKYQHKDFKEIYHSNKTKLEKPLVHFLVSDDGDIRNMAAKSLRSVESRLGDFLVRNLSHLTNNRNFVVDILPQLNVRKNDFKNIQIPKDDINSLVKSFLMADSSVESASLSKLISQIPSSDVEKSILDELKKNSPLKSPLRGGH